MKNLHLAFDVGHSSLGWAVLQIQPDNTPTILGTGAVIFQADDCLASQRRGFRRQRRHIRATRLRIERLKRLLLHLGVLTREQLDTPGCAWPWLLAARVLRDGPTLTWPELWDVLRWYAHNRGYDGNKAWSRQENPDAQPEAAAALLEDTEKVERARTLLEQHSTRTMSETWCAVCGLDPLGDKKSVALEGAKRPRGLNAAFPREIIETEVHRILQAHLGKLPALTDTLITAILTDHTALPGPDYRLPKRYGQLVRGQRTPGGLLFGQLVPRFDNRIIATCPVQFQREYERALAQTGDPAQAAYQAGKLAKVPSVHCPEFYRFRWAMQLANVNVATADPRKPRRLTYAERRAINTAMEKRGALTPGEFKETVRTQTGTDKDNLDRLLSLPDADKSLILDPARKLATSGLLGTIWPHLNDRTQRHTLTNLRRGKTITARALLAACPAARDAADQWCDTETKRKIKPTKKNPNPAPPTRDFLLDTLHSIETPNGRAAHSREVMADVWNFVLGNHITDPTTEGGHPMDEDGPLFRSEAIRRAQLQRAIDEQTNNHLVRHRLKLLERLHADLLAEYAAADPDRVQRITIEVNRSLKELSGKTAQEQAKEQGQQTAQFRNVEKKLTAAYEGHNVRLGPGLIRKGRIAEDLAWTCPYTGKRYDEFDLLHRRVDKDHIVPRSQRQSDSLDSLAITYSEINKWKGNRTARQFIEEEAGKPVPGLPNVTIKSLNAFLKDIESLETFKGHDDDQRRKKNRKRLFLLRDYIEKEFTPGDLTKTSQLVRLGAEALQRAYLDRTEKPTVVSLPGSVTAAVRKTWDLAGCLATANPNVLNPEDLDQNGHPRVHRKTELRGITHLHHALDACVLGMASHVLPCDGGTWKREVLQLLAKRRCNPAEQTILRDALGAFIQFTSEGEPRLISPSTTLRDQLRTRLAERRVVQHLPASMADMTSDQTVWRVFDPTDDHPNAQRLARWLREAEIEIPAPDAKTVLIITRKRKADAQPGEKPEAAGGKSFHTGKTWRWIYDTKAKDALLGYSPKGEPEKSKLKSIKAVKVLGDNFGIALDPEPTLIRPLHVYRQLSNLRKANHGKWPRVLRLGMIIRIERAKTAKVDYRGVWMLRGVQFNQKAGFLVDLSPADQIKYRGEEGSFQNVSLKTLVACGLEILDGSLCGVAALPSPKA